jgi:hypothetical protein
MPRGKEQEFTREEVFEALEATHGRLFLAAARLGCSVRTLHRYRERYPELQDCYEAHRGRRVDVAELKLEQAVNQGQPWAILHTLNTLGRDRGYGKEPVRDLSTDDTPPVHYLQLPDKSPSAEAWSATYGPSADA